MSMKPDVYLKPRGSITEMESRGRVCLSSSASTPHPPSIQMRMPCPPKVEYLSITSADVMAFLF
jgi:hypothetical protein